METLYKYIVISPDPSINPSPYFTEDGLIVMYDTSYFSLVDNTLVPLAGVTVTTEAAYLAQLGSTPEPSPPSTDPTTAYGAQNDTTILDQLGPSVSNVLPFSPENATLVDMIATATGFEIVVPGVYNIRAGVTATYVGPGFGRLYVTVDDLEVASSNKEIAVGEHSKETIYVHHQRTLEEGHEVEIALLYQGFDTAIVEYHELVVEKVQ